MENTDTVQPESEARKNMLGSTMANLGAEIVRARTKFPGNAKLLAALTEEVGELAQAMLQRKPIAEIVKEALQVACVAVRIAEEGDSDFAAHMVWGDAK